MTNDNENTIEVTNTEVTNNENTIESLHSRLAEIQVSLKSPKGKTHFKGWKHRSAEDILHAVKPLLDGLSIIQSDEIVSVFPPFVYSKKTKKKTRKVDQQKDRQANVDNNVVFMNQQLMTVSQSQSPHIESATESDVEEESVADSYVAGVYLKATATISNGTHSISAYGWAKESPVKPGLDEPQLTGMASSYARKYALCGLLGIDGSQDSDEFSDAQARKAVTSPTQQQSNTAQKATAPTTSQSEKWKKDLIEQAKGDVSVLDKISDTFKYGIKSEKQYHFFANKLTAMGYKKAINKKG